ncbi:MAG: ribose 5-phosphate isomerase B [Clostridiales Family XIII bacterium]|jgi:ribose 5-phosphate isomerase B|nr:ribose 5-phosphate isomerase B [Clostridiales Family XIII bacterium]
MRIAIASDHGGFELKGILVAHLAGLGHEVIDLGTDGPDSVDYPVYGKKCAECVAGGTADKGIVICGTGIGVSIAANKVRGIRCALVTSDVMAELASDHNDANMIALGGRTTTPDEAKRWSEIWLATPFSRGERHERRVALLNEM